MNTPTQVTRYAPHIPSAYGDVTEQNVMQPLRVVYVERVPICPAPGMTYIVVPPDRHPGRDMSDDNTIISVVAIGGGIFLIIALAALAVLALYVIGPESSGLLAGLGLGGVIALAGVGAAILLGKN